MSALAQQLGPLRRRQIAGPAVFAVATVAMVLAIGIPQQRDVVAIWMLLGLLSFSLGDVRGYALGVVRDWLPFFGLLIAYDTLRGSAKGLFATHFLPQLQVDQWLFGGTAPTNWLQHRLWTGHVRWYDIAVTCVYISHFLATPVLAATLWKLDRNRFQTFVGMVGVLSAAGLLTYALYPAAPPWMAGQVGLLPHVTRIIGTHSAGSMFETGEAYANNVAAVPSLHTAFALLVAYTLWPRRHRRLRPLVSLYPLAMAFSLTYTGEHYFSDVLLGWLYGLGAILLVRWIARRRAQRRATAVAAARRPLPGDGLQVSAPPSARTPGSTPKSDPRRTPAGRQG